MDEYAPLPCFLPRKKQVTRSLSSTDLPLDGRRVLAVRQATVSEDRPSERPSIPFSTSWSVSPNAGLPHYSGRSYFFSPSTRSIYAAYGRTPDSQYSADFWQFSLSTPHWAPLPVRSPSGRAFCSQVVIGNRVWFFGGATANGAAQDLHFLDLATLSVDFPAAAGPAPPGGKSPLLVADGNRILVWSSVSPSLLYFLSTETLLWTSVATQHLHPGAGISGAVVKQTLFVFGASLALTALEVDLADLKVTVVRTSGAEPAECDRFPVTVVGMTAVALPAHGRGVFVFDCAKKVWVCCSTEKNAENRAIACFYDKERRVLLAVWAGHADVVAELQIGEPFAQINQQLDLLAIIGM